MEKYNYRTYISSRPKRVIRLPLVSMNLPSKFHAALLVQITSMDYRPVDRKIDHLIEMIKGLAFLVRTLQNNTGFSTTKNI